MKLYSSPASPFARKCRIVARELGIELEVIDIDPWTNEEFRRINPLSKIPTLVLDDNSVLYDSRVICDYLNEFKNGQFIPAQSMWRTGSGRWRALSLQAVGDGMADAAVACVRETKLPEDRRNGDNVARAMAAIVASLDLLERAAPKFAAHPTIGEVAVGCALGYLDFRLAHLGWRATRPKLAAWYDEFAKYPSMAATAPVNLK